MCYEEGVPLFDNEFATLVVLQSKDFASSVAFCVRFVRLEGVQSLIPGAQEVNNMVSRRIVVEFYKIAVTRRCTRWHNSKISMDKFKKLLSDCPCRREGLLKCELDKLLARRQDEGLAAVQCKRLRLRELQRERTCSTV